jgi:hypothetical protein
MEKFDLELEHQISFYPRAWSWGSVEGIHGLDYKRSPGRKLPKLENEETCHMVFTLTFIRPMRGSHGYERWGLKDYDRRMNRSFHLMGSRGSQKWDFQENY